IDTFNLAGAAAYNLKGGAGVDVFVLGDNTLTCSMAREVNVGSITGRSSATLTTQGATTGFNGTAASVSTGFSNITDLQGTGTLRSEERRGGKEWEAGRESDGWRWLTFGSFATLVGCTAIGTFNRAAAAI